LQGCAAEGLTPQTGVKTPAYFQRAPAGRDTSRAERPETAQGGKDALQGHHNNARHQPGGAARTAQGGKRCPAGASQQSATSAGRSGPKQPKAEKMPCRGITTMRDTSRTERPETAQGGKRCPARASQQSATSAGRSGPKQPKAGKDALQGHHSNRPGL